MDNRHQLTSGSIPGLIRRIAIPASVGYFFNTMYNVVDTYYGGTISTQALAALSLTFPVFFIIIAVSSGLATGTTALIGTALGAGDPEKAEILSLQGITFGLFVAVGLTFFGLWASPYLFGILGASEEYLGLCLGYMNAIFWGSVFFMISNMLNAILNAAGNTRTFRNFLIAGFFLNLVLDPWFIHGGFGLPALGFSGIALATVLIQAAGCLYLGVTVRRIGLVSRISLAGFWPRWSVFEDIARQGFPAAVNMATIGLGIFVITYFISQFGQEGVAAYGIAVRVEQIALLPSIGLNVSTLAIVAQNHGARLYGRIWETIGASLKYGGMMMVVGGILVFVLSGRLMEFFTGDATVIAIGATYLKIDALVLYAYVVLFVHVAALQGVKKPMYAVWIGLYRQIAAPLAVFYLLSRVLGLGLLGVWWGIFIVTWSAAGITLWYGRRSLKQALDRPPK